MIGCRKTAILNRAALGGGKANRDIVAIYGAGKSTYSAGNIQLKRDIKSMAGACAIGVANSLIRDSIKLDTLLTIDPVPLSFSM